MNTNYLNQYKAEVDIGYFFNRLGNVTTKTVTVSNVDIIPPKLEINYDNNPTNENISLSVSATDEESGVNEITLPDGSIVTE